MFSQQICSVQLKTAWNSELSNKNTGDFSLVRNYLQPSNNSRQLFFNINAVGLIDIFVKIYENGKMFTSIWVFLLYSWKIETLFPKLEYQKLQTMQL